MNVNRVITVREGEALSALRQFLAGWWKSYALDALLAPVEAAGQPAVTMQAVEDPAGLAAVNPWAPVMLSNAAAALGEFAERRPGRRLAAVLHPCEIRTIVELRRQGRLPAAASSVVIIGMDCPGTFPAE